jgi:hypothetical protein
MSEINKPDEESSSIDLERLQLALWRIYQMAMQASLQDESQDPPTNVGEQQLQQSRERDVNNNPRAAA